jgi:heat-inducible transcriptional repressor
VARRVRRIGGPLDPRAQVILRAVIEEHISTAAPVGSQALVERYGLDVSSATVRNILAELELAGLLTHPHTSAGRVPTDSGYRFYVESLTDAAALPPVEQLMIRHQFGQVEYASEQWFRLAASILASTTHAAGLATPAKPKAARVRRIDLVAIQERLASLIVILQQGSIKQVLLSMDEPTDDETLAAAADLVNATVSDLTAEQIVRRLGRFDDGTPSGALARRTADAVAGLLREYDAATIEDLFSDGLLNVMAAPEFTETQKVRRVFAALENRAYLSALIGAVAGEGPGSVRVFIGHENPPEEMSDVSLVLAPYGTPGRAVGVVGVLGPTRMSYPLAIETVRFVSSLMHELVDHSYA